MGSAAFRASATVYMQDSAIDLQAFYRADRDFGDGNKPTKGGYATIMLGRFADTPIRLAASGGDTNGFAVQAARNADGSLVQILISNYEIDADKRGPRTTTPETLSPPGLFTMKLLPRRTVSYADNKGYELAARLPAGGVYQVERYRLSETQDFEQLESRRIEGRELRIRDHLAPPGLDLIVLRRIATRH
jgi:hypothetical protein